MVWISVNLAVALVIGGSWALAVRALHNGLADPDARPLPGAVRPDRHAA
jgi:hypothetical protein